jgi:hypothetical protein
MVFLKGLAAAAVLSYATYSHAVFIEYDLTSLGSGSYQYDYEVTNNDISTGLEEFTIYFDAFNTANLAIVGSPTGWDSIVIQPDPLLPDEGFFDSLFLSSPLALGDSINGFSVTFDWVGGGAGPTSQFFEVYDASFNVVTSGITTEAVSDSHSVPEPTSAALIILGLLGLAVQRHSKKGITIA